MHPRSLTLRGARGASAVFLALFVAAVVDARPPVKVVPRAAVRALPPMPTGAQDKKDDKKDEKKDAKPPEITWPTEINGKDLKTTLTDMEDPDPTIREAAVRALPGFGPPAGKTKVSKLLIKRMNVEKDPGVKAAVYAAVAANTFEEEADNKEALRLLVAAVNAGGPLRTVAVQSIGLFGPKGADAIAILTGNAITDPSYVTRQTIANTLGRIGFHELAGPNIRALTALADKLARDESAAVRMEALQALMILGPPWLAPRKVDDKTPPPIDMKSVDVIVKSMRARVGDPKTKVPALEKDKQVEIWARMVLMRFDPKEINDENLDAIARYLTGPDHLAKLQALEALGFFGEGAARKLDAVVRVMEDKTSPLLVLIGAIRVLGAMGAGAKPALPNLKKMLAEKQAELSAKKLELAKKKDDLRLNGEVATLEELVKLLEAVIKHIEAAKITSPAELKTDPKTDPKKP